MSTLERKPNSIGHRSLVTSVSIPRKASEKNCVCCRKVGTIMFSNIGLFALVIGYTYLGAIIFRHLEAPHENGVTQHVIAMRNITIVRLWNITDKFNVIYKKNWTLMVTDEIMNFQLQLMQAVREGYDGRDAVDGQPQQWSISSAFLYSLTVITTIGYGNTAPKTNEGKVATIIYAIIGIPIMVLFLANSGHFLANCARNLYLQCCGNPANIENQSIIDNGTSFVYHTHHGHNHLHDTCHINHIALNELGQSQQPNSVCHCSATKQYCNSATGHNQKYIVPNQFLTITNASGAVEADCKLSPGNCLLNDHRCTDTITRCSHVHCVPHASLAHNYHCNHHADQINRNVGCAQSISNRSSNEENNLEQHHSNIRSGTIVTIVIICFLVICGYICLGATCLYRLEGWTLLDGAYFCFLALSTIGFGGFTSDASMLFTLTANIERKLIIFGCYVLIGMVLVAMCFNLLEDKIVIRVKNRKQNFAANEEDTYDEEEAVADLQKRSQLLEQDDFEA